MQCLEEDVLVSLPNRMSGDSLLVPSYLDYALKDLESALRSCPNKVAIKS